MSIRSQSKLFCELIERLNVEICEVFFSVLCFIEVLGAVLSKTALKVQSALMNWGLFENPVILTDLFYGARS